MSMRDWFKPAEAYVEIVHFVGHSPGREILPGRIAYRWYWLACWNRPFHWQKVTDGLVFWKIRLLP